MKYLIKRTLTYFDKGDDELAGEVPLIGIDLPGLQAIFCVDPEDPMYECYVVGPEHVEALQPHVSVTIDTNLHDYFVEATGLPIGDDIVEGEVVDQNVVEIHA